MTPEQSKAMTRIILGVVAVGLAFDLPYVWMTVTQAISGGVLISVGYCKLINKHK